MKKVLDFVAYKVTVDLCYSSFYEVMWTEIRLQWEEEYLGTFSRSLVKKNIKMGLLEVAKSKRLDFVITEN